MKSSAVYAYHLARMWPERNSERVHVFADGSQPWHFYDRDARRASIRQNLRAQRSFRSRGD